MKIGICIAVVVGLILWVASRSASEAARRLQDAQETYRERLRLLRERPNDPDLKGKALEWGRYYADLTRQQKGVTLYDELAVANDIKEACTEAKNQKHAGASATPQPTQVQLDNLRAHFERGAITAQEYQSRRRKLLDEV